MEYRRGRPDQARPCRRSHSPAAHALRAGGLTALRPGQMVSRRKPAALGVWAVLAQGRRVDLDRSGADRQRRRPARCDHRAGRAHHRRYRHASRRRPRICIAGLRRSDLLDAEGIRAAAQRRSVRSQDRRSRNARPHGAHLRAWLVESVRLRAAGAALERGGEGPPLEKRKVESAARQTVSGAGRFAAGLQAAARRAALGAAGRISLHQSAGPERAAARRCRRTSA